MIYAPFPEKRCARCRKYLPVVEFSVDRSKRGMRASSCRTCRKLRNPEPESLPPETRRCRKCRKIVPFDDLVKSSKNKSGVDTICLECNRKNVKQYYDAHPEYMTKSIARVHDWRIEHRQQALTAGYKWRRNHREHVNALRRERADQRRRLHPAILKKRRHPTLAERRMTKQMAQARRRAREFALPYDWKLLDWECCLRYWQGCCAVCGRPVGLWHRIVQDHWIALSDSRLDNPGTVPWNIVPLCQSHGLNMRGCNNSKGKRDPIEWLNERLGPRKARKKLAEIQAYFDSVRR